MAQWNYKQWGSAVDAIHKSDLKNITGDYGCDKQFRFYKDAVAAERNPEPKVGGKAACGNAAHETIARALNNLELRERLLSGTHTMSRPLVDEVFREEYEKEVAGREVLWNRKDRPDGVIYDRVSMVLGLLNRLHVHVAEIVEVEAGFIVPIKVSDTQTYWLAGHVDLLYRPRELPIALAISDWKTGSQKPHQIELDHGWESGVYSLAVKDGVWISRDELHTEILPARPKTDTEPARPAGMRRVTCRGVSADHFSFSQASKRAMEAALSHIATAHELHEETGGEKGEAMAPTFGEFPQDIRYVHLQDLVPYQKAGSKEIKRPEDCAFFNVPAFTKVNYKAGELRGPAWLPVRRTEQDIPRLATQLRNVVGTVRMGRFAERTGEKCERCPFREACLTTGYEVRGAERAQVRSLLSVLRDADVDDGLSAA